ncbi:hypothetical protein Drose_26940 [Dactylosporangium roseum]|uniref:Uncharacterized protein n=1 Tax=Dactylosporangium roseum TaxID=47989 RepID=A0ABY5YYI1_9ACTN|nr:hypothetical protein [Dactylosporangium roseum]UWZ34805.1 hypothetical protein Drose_26940 [Dactylosporangium roseum]
MSVRIENPEAYTEAAHTAYAAVSGAEPIEAGGRWFTPTMVTVHVRWRTQIGYGWVIERIEISGPWVPRAEGAAPAGSGRVILGLDNAPQWAAEHARGCVPGWALPEASGPEVVPGVRRSQWPDGERRVSG